MLENFNKLYLAITIFITLYLLLNIIQPDAIYNHEQNCLRHFGVGYKNTSVITLWIATILLAIFSYFIVIYIHNLNNNWF